jgi:HK97 family phage portal protein
VSGFLAGLFEQRFHVSQTPPGWVKKLGGWDTATGVDVTPDKALQVAAVFACVRILAETVASLPLPIYRRLGNGGKARAPDHYLYPILHDQPNPEMTSFSFRETMMGHVATWGNAYAEIEFNQGGGINALWPLRPDRMRVKREGGRLQYLYRVPDKVGGQEITLEMERIFHVRGLSNNGIVGYSPIQLARQSVGLALAAEEFGGRFFGNDARPGVILEHPGKLSEEAHKRLRESWESRHGGLDKSHRVAILEEGLQVHEIGLPPGDAQFLETRKYQRSEIASIFRMPPHMIGDLERATFSNIEQQSLEFVIYTLWPWLVRWEQEIKRCLFTPIEARMYFAEFLVEGLLRGDIQSRYQAYATGRQWGWMSANDVRRLENMNPIEGGDAYLVPLNMIPAGQAGLEPFLEDLGTGGARRRALVIPNFGDGEGDDQLQLLGDPGPKEERRQRSARTRHRLMLAYQKVYLDVAARIVRREINDVGKAARKWFKQRDMARFSLWLEEFYRQDHIEFVTRNMTPLAMSYGEVVAAEAQDEVGEPAEMSPRVEGFIQSYVDAYAARHVNISESRIREVVRQAIEEDRDPVEALEEAFGDWEEKRPAEIARWETVRFNNALAVGIYLMAQRQTIRWMAFNKSCPYCVDLDGQVVGIKSWFIPAGTEFQPEGAERPLTISHNLGHPPAHDGCDCMVISG